MPPGDAPHMAKISDLNMLAMMGGQERTEAEWRELLTDAGYAGTASPPDWHAVLDYRGNGAITTPPSLTRRI